MKLYATVTSERASKSQGGQEFIAGEITGDRVKLLEFHIAPAANEDEYWLSVRVRGERVREVLIKGEKQKTP